MTFSWDLWRFTDGVRLRIALAVLLGLLAVTAGVARLALLGWMAARIFEGESFSSLAPLIIAAAVITLARSGFLYAKEELANGTAVRVQFRLRQRLFNRVMALGPAHFDRQRTGDVTVGVVEGVEQLETYFGQYLPQLIVAAIAPIGIFAFMVFLDLPVAGIFLGVALLTLALPSLLQRETRPPACAAATPTARSPQISSIRCRGSRRSRRSAKAAAAAQRWPSAPRRSSAPRWAC